MFMCSYHNSFFESDDFLASISHILTVIEIFIHSFGAYIILYKTPAKMINVKWVLFLNHFWESFLDIFMSGCMIPMIFFPAAIGYPLGLLSLFGVPTSFQIYIVISCIAAVASALCATFENRYHMIVKNSHKTITASWSRLTLACFNYCMAFLFMTPLYLALPDTKTGIEFYQRMLPCIPKSVYERELFFVLTTDGKLVGFLLCFIINFYLLQALFYIGSIVFNFGKMGNVSKKTTLLQRNMFFAIFYQFATPFILILMPVVYFIYSFLSGYYNQAFNNFALVFVTLHGLFGTISMIIAHRPYRHVFFNLCSLLRHRFLNFLTAPTVTTNIEPTITVLNNPNRI